MAEKESVVYKNGAVYVLQTGTPIYVKTADICSITGKSNQWIGQLTSQGTIHKTKTAKGSMYELGSTLSAYCKMLEKRADDDIDPEDAENEKKRRKADAAIKSAKAVMLGLDVKEREGKMHRSEDVAAMTEDLIFNIRSNLLSLPGRLATEVSQLSDPAVISTVIQREVYSIMEELSNYKYDSKKYEERVRARRNLGALNEISDDE